MRSWTRRQHSGPDFDKCGVRLGFAERRRISARHPRLGAEFAELGMQCGTPRRVKMSEDLVKEEDRSSPGHLAHQSRMRQHEPDQKRFLLAGRSVRGRDALCRIGDVEVAQMRAIERASRSRIAAASVAQCGAVALLEFARGKLLDEFLLRGLDGDFGRLRRCRCHRKQRDGR